MKTIIIEDEAGEVVARVTVASYEKTDDVIDVASIIMEKGVRIRNGE